MNGCTLGLHTWVYIREGKSRWCKKCEKKQEMGLDGKWVESRPATRAVDRTKYCECPRDYTIAIKLKNVSALWVASQAVGLSFPINDFARTFVQTFA